ncbi:glycosyltransferase family 2 protein [Rhodospirillum rubrum]|uniref:Glycosyl transferase, family 2 n=1 Tax=Rhodospirillum rubrum (strain ATCC 11170 / ATH 1.1.1 / DSM 467 / LMG 4362 / NCIMB 8255 / S1) TaxID=269796 RepID=Q2RPR0_RHORT|nr:glycosyltransferase family A protein [Rhodospirillum rubrum]ABC23885.1 Glycosyl transferase, family 2 [Rhodospirillum rubrum ATCC 11170]AEO49629.1 glycosyl transferase family protein [Rhodospirillum rubrum F11]MBK5955561.1 glycosyl transferase [Rhodospirillum rubrum]QXG79831.1 glycosyltransferase family 2 protein [Rhodospirillum rubrum]HCF19114.1 glycosyltransferase family 2 protein [Rhodospirillum rubrum]
MNPGGAEVSVVIPAWNAEATLGRALASVRAQTLAPRQVIVVNDGSSDATPEIAARMATKTFPVTVIDRTGRGSGPAAARNAGIAAAGEPFVAFLDADDVWLPDKLARQMAALRASPDAVLCCCDAQWVGEDAPARTAHPTIYEDRPIKGGAEAWKEILLDCYVGTPCVVARRAALIEAGGFDERLVVGEDQDLWIRLALQGPVIALPEVLVRYGLSADSHMARHRALAASLWLPHFEALVSGLGARLSAGERDAILRARLWRMARSVYLDGRKDLGLSLMARAVAHGLPRRARMVFLARARLRSALGRNG